ncbi:hypothetical protein F4860DRAFT_494688 [Xylaria cubensis]|nr:hypothetical protein F4860DRAFT_494688 [Xylaria cubensis]
MARQNISRSSADWLPFHATPTLTTKSVNTHYINSHKDSDWFVQLAYVMDNETPGSTQGKIFIKFYIFLRDFHPRGLVDDWAHINGRDVMDHLLCHAEHTLSRHKISKAADAAFTDLGRWIGSHSNWRSSLQNAEADAAQPSRTRKKGERKKAPGLHSPAGLLALLVIAHPDMRFKELIGRLGIDWMIQPRSTLDVQEGFWKGLNASNVYEVFSTEEVRQAETPLLIDYTALFQNFEMARKDIRPFVKGWEDRISLRKASNTTKNHSSTINNQPRIQARVPAQETIDTAALKSLLYPDTTKKVAELETWLLSKLADSPSDDSLHQWCRHWEDRIDAVANFEEQVIVRSLFVQSLRRLAGFVSTGTSAARSYMLLDMDEAELQPERTVPEDMSDDLQMLETLPLYQQCQAVNNKLLVTAGNHHQAMKETINELWLQQAHFFMQILTAPGSYADWRSVMDLEVQRTQVILDSFVDAPKEDKDWLGKKDIIWDRKTIKILNLTRWQLRALVAPGAFRVLTDWQARAFYQKFCLNPSQRMDTTNPSHIDLSSYPTTSVVKSSLVEEHQSLHKLFGELNNPRGLDTVEPYVLAQGPTEGVIPKLAQPPIALARAYIDASFQPERDPAGAAQPLGKPMFIPPPTAVVREVAQDFITHETVRRDRDIAPETAQPDGVVSAPTATLAGGQLSRSFSIADMFKGKTSSKKRPASPDRRPSKAMKLDFTLEELSKTQRLIRDEMQAEMRITREELHASMSSNTKGLGDRIQHVVQATENEAVAKLDSLRQAIEGTVTTEQHAKLLSQVQQVQSQVNGISVMMNNQSQMLQNMVQPQQHKDLALQVKKGFESQEKMHKQTQTQTKEHQTQLRIMQEDITEMKELPQPRATGPSCPAPPGWKQEAYESMLIGAAWYYITCFKDNEVEFDKEVWERLEERFPELEHEHIVQTLKDVRMQVYGKPLYPEE